MFEISLLYFPVKEQVVFDKTLQQIQICDAKLQIFAVFKFSVDLQVQTFILQFLLVHMLLYSLSYLPFLYRLYFRYVHKLNLLRVLVLPAKFQILYVDEHPFFMGLVGRLGVFGHKNTFFEEIYCRLNFFSLLLFLQFVQFHFFHSLFFNLFLINCLFLLLQWIIRLNYTWRH